MSAGTVNGRGTVKLNGELTKARTIASDRADSVGHSILCQCPACERITHRAWERLALAARGAA